MIIPLLLSFALFFQPTCHAMATNPNPADLVEITLLSDTETEDLLEWSNNCTCLEIFLSECPTCHKYGLDCFCGKNLMLCDEYLNLASYLEPQDPAASDESPPSPELLSEIHCPLCNKNFPLFNDGKFSLPLYFAYVAHNQTIHKKTPSFPCPYQSCPYTAKYKSHLTTHIQAKHSDEKKHQCPHCAFSTAYKSHFTRHIETIHSGEKKHQCPLCDFSSADQSNLKRHTKSKHSGEKKHQCPLCKYAAARKDYLKKHIRKHSGKNHSSVTTATTPQSKKES